jgi:hypothetical protein
MGGQNRDRASRGPRAIAWSLAAAGGAIVLGALPVDAQQAPPTASADFVCDDTGGAIIRVSIVDDFSTTYDVFIDDELVDDDVTDSDGGFYSYGPVADGVYNVRVFWNQGEEDILDQDLTVDCAVEETTTTAPTTTTTVPPAVAPVVEAPSYTG